MKRFIDLVDALLFTEDEEEWGIDVDESTAVLLTYFVGGAFLAIPILCVLLLVG